MTKRLFFHLDRCSAHRALFVNPDAAHCESESWVRRCLHTISDTLEAE